MRSTCIHSKHCGLIPQKKPIPFPVATVLGQLLFECLFCALHIWIDAEKACLCVEGKVTFSKASTIGSWSSRCSRSAPSFQPYRPSRGGSHDMSQPLEGLVRETKFSTPIRWRSTSLSILVRFLENAFGGRLFENSVFRNLPSTPKIELVIVRT